MTRSGLAPRPCGHARQSPGCDCTPLSTLRRPTHPPARVQRLIVSHDTISMGNEGICAIQSGIDVHLSASGWPGGSMERTCAARGRLPLPSWQPRLPTCTECVRYDTYTEYELNWYLVLQYQRGQRK